MIIKTDDIKDLCSLILNAVDTSELSVITETLQLKAEKGCLEMAVTNMEYYVKVKLYCDTDEIFKATVNANLFLKLVSQTTTENIELNTDSNCLIVTGNGSYKLPLIFDGNSLLELPDIRSSAVGIKNSFSVSTEHLQSILQNNSKQIKKGNDFKQIHRLFYIDEEGAITFTPYGACVNEFKLEKPIKMLLTQKFVKLFKLFKGDSVQLTLEFKQVGLDDTQDILTLEDDSISMTSYLPKSSGLVSSVPVTAIRDKAFSAYKYSVSFNRNELLQALNRMLLFHENKYQKSYNTFEFNESSVRIYDSRKSNVEEVKYLGSNLIMSGPYTAVLDINDFKSALDNSTDQAVRINFGDSQAFVLSKGTVHTIIAEVE